MASSRDMFSHFNRKVHDFLGGAQTDRDRWEELQDKYVDLADQYRQLAEDVGENSKKLRQYNRECRQLYCAVGPAYEEYTILQTVFSGEGSIPYYVDYFLDVCRRRAPVKEDAESAELFAYKNILSMIRMKLEDIGEKLKKIPVYDDSGFERYYEIHPVEEMPESAPVFAVCDVYRMSEAEYETLRKMHRQLKADFTRLKETNQAYEETVSYLQRIREEWNNRKEYLDFGKAGQYRLLYRKLQEIPWEEYALQEEEGADAYKNRLLELAGMLKGLVEMIL